MKCRELAAVVAGVMLLGACSGGDSGPEVFVGELECDITEYVNAEWLEQMNQIYVEGDDLDRAIVEDCIVTEAEVKDAQQPAVDCVNSHGYPDFYFADTGGYAISPDGYILGQGPSEEEENRQADVMFRCVDAAEGMWASSLYYEMKRNPHNLDHDDAIAECLVMFGYVDQGFSGQDYRDELLSWPDGEIRGWDQWPWESTEQSMECQMNAYAYVTR